MANLEHLEILKQGVEVWNEWRRNNQGVNPDLTNADLTDIDLYGVHFGACTLNGVKLRGVRLSSGNLKSASLVEADLSNADVHGSTLTRANFTRAKLVKTNFGQCVLTRTNFAEANLTEARFVEAMMIMTNFENANLESCDVYGISAWDLSLGGSNQRNLRITRWDEPLVTVDNIEVAQFVYLLLSNEKLRHIIDTLTTKSVLILGRFNPERKAVLDAIREELRKRGYVPILFDFEKPDNRDLTETVMTLAGLSRFVIADLSDPHSIPHELMSFAEKLLSVPVQPIFCPVPEHPKEYPMIEHLRRYSHVLPVYQYQTPDQLIALLSEKVIEPAEAKVNEMRPNAL
jgi:hypothetical protein